MSVYVEGKDTAPGAVANLKNLTPGKEYVFQYKAPAFAFKLLGPDQITSILKGWISLRSKLSDAKGTIVTISGVRMNTDTGEIFMRARVSQEDQEIIEAGVNPWAVAAVFGAIFAAIGIGVSLLYVYEVSESLSGGASSGPSTDPCTESGVVPYVKCLAKKSAWVATGLVIGALAMLVLLLLTLGRRD